MPSIPLDCQPAAFRLPISSNGRQVQIAIWNWFSNHWNMLGSNTAQVAAKFAELYNPVYYEDVGLAYDANKVCKFIKKEKLTTKVTPASVAAIIKLEPLLKVGYENTDIRWELAKSNPAAPNFRNEPHANEMYLWFSQELKWLRTDYSYHEAWMLREICNASKEQIKACIKGIQDHIRSITYLHKVLTNDTARVAENRALEEEWTANTAKAMKTLEIPAVPIVGDPNKNPFEGLDIEVEMLDAMEDNAKIR